MVTHSTKSHFEAQCVAACPGHFAPYGEYGPFGEVLRSTGPMAKANPFRFSTKYQDDETDLLYYGYRYYNPSTGRWLSRDPIHEKGGFNLYAFVANNPVSEFDILGQRSCERICRMAEGSPRLNNPKTRPGVVVCYDGQVCPCVFGDPHTGWTPGECPDFAEERGRS